MTATKPELIRGLHNLRARHRGSVVTIGSFDGVHLGHQAILKQLVAAAKQRQLPAVVMIFEPQPQEYFAPAQAPARLMRFRDKVEALFAEGVDRVLCVRFDHDLQRRSADAFVRDILVNGLGTQHLVVGDDFRFGCDRAGNYAMLQQAGVEHGFSVTDTATCVINNVRVSSTRIRQVLANNNFAFAAELLGKPYEMSGRVVYGQQLGRTLGAPTANILLQRNRSPLMGVFAVTLRVDGKRSNSAVYEGVANVGVRPTVSGPARSTLEVHLFDFNGSLYGERVQVEFLHKLREEQKFASLEQLQTQIQRDIVAAKHYFLHG